MTIDYYDATATYVPSEAQRFCVESWNEDTGVERERLQGEEFLTRRQAWRLARHLGVEVRISRVAWDGPNGEERSWTVWQGIARA